MTTVVTGMARSVDPAETWEGWAKWRYLDATYALAAENQTHTARVERARTLLGYTLRVAQRYDFGPTTETWQRTRGPELGGLPRGVCQAAAEACVAETAAEDALAAAERQADAYARQHRLSPAAAETKKELDTAELVTALRTAREAADEALSQLGAAAEELAAIRAEISAIPARIRTRRQECASAEASDLAREQDLRAALAHYGELL